MPLEWIRDAGHYSNTDQPELVNNLIAKLVVEKNGTHLPLLPMEISLKSGNRGSCSNGIRKKTDA